MKSSKSYKITYKVLSNPRLKEVDFHGTKMYPLYIRIGYNRKDTLLKSYFFDLYSQNKFNFNSLQAARVVEAIIKREGELVRFILRKISDDFSLERFKNEYNFYNRSILELIEVQILNYLNDFFLEVGASTFGSMIIKNGNVDPFQLLKNLKVLLESGIYRKMIIGGPKGLESLILMSEFSSKIETDLPSFFPVYLWEQRKQDLVDFLITQFESFNIEDFESYIISVINKKVKE